MAGRITRWSTAPVEVDGVPTVSTAEACRVTGATVRQLHHWIDIGAVRPITRAVERGTGTALGWALPELAAAAVLVELSALGVSPAAAASAMWRVAEQVERGEVEPMVFGPAGGVAVSVRLDIPVCVEALRLALERVDGWRFLGRRWVEQ